MSNCLKSSMGRTPPSVFIDSSVFFAAAYSVNGSAHDLLQAGIQGRVVLVLSENVLEETEGKNAPRAHAAFLRLRDSLPHRLTAPSRRLVIETAEVVVAKDAPIIAAARAARVDFVATYDRKDLLSKQAEIRAAFELAVVTPDTVLQSLT